MSMQFGPLLQYAMKAISYYNRRSISQVFIWVLIFSLGLMSFHPFNLQKRPITICRPGAGLEEPSCVTIMLSRNDRPTYGRDPVGFIGPSIRPSTTKRTPTISPKRCPTDWFNVFQNSNLNREVVVLTSELVACDSLGRIIPPYSEDQCVRKENVAPYANRGDQTLFDCSDPSKEIRDFDQCGNIRLGDAKKKFVEMIYTNEKFELILICADCYDYTQYTQFGNTQSLKYCHMQSSEQARAACVSSRGAQVSPVILVDVNTDVKGLGLRCISGNEFISTCPVHADWWELQGGVDGASVRIMKACDQNGTPVLPFSTELGGDCFNPSAGKVIDGKDVLPYLGTVYLKLRSCINQDLPLNYKRDSCQNVVYLSSGAVAKSRIVARPIILRLSGNTFGLVCCYDYYFMEGNEESIQFCHMSTQRQADLACKPEGPVVATREAVKLQITDSICEKY